MTNIVVSPIAFVRNSRRAPTDDFWGSIVSEIELAGHVPSEALAGIGTFSHLEVIFFFDQVDPRETVWSGRPRGNRDWPVAGIFAQRKKDRPNRLGLSTVELVGYADRKIVVRYLDAIDGTPVLDIKPVFREFQPKTPVRQPLWAKELMKEYWA
ncbi:MAG TPA: SAM-dependent methyltransferase [Puia sp.]|nr:SAM-dependent methyltransferase [Puia sp.]